MPLDLGLFALRLQDIDRLARAAMRERNKAVSDEYQQEIAALAAELLAALEAERVSLSRSGCAAPAPGRRAG